MHVLPRVSALFLSSLLLSSRGAVAQVDLTGEWRSVIHEDVGLRIDDPLLAGGIPGAEGPRIGDYAGLPINAAARLKAESWDPRIESAAEHQLIVHPAAYWLLPPGGVRLSKSVDERTQAVVAYTLYRAGGAGSSTRTIWMDGRMHPPAYAPHTWQGFSSGYWIGDTLRVTTSHLKAGFIRRNGVPSSDQATVTELFARHGAVMTVIAIVTDAIYLEEPFVYDVTWVYDTHQQLPAPPVSTITDEIPGHSKRFVPHFLPDQNAALSEFAHAFGIPIEATRGGAATAYPEYQQVMAGQRRSPGR
jgi:hypothetical protein